MKKFILVALILIGARASYAQDSLVMTGGFEPQKPWNEIVDSLFSHLDTTYFTSKYLYEKGFFFYDPTSFDGSNNTSRSANIGAFKSIHDGISSSAISPSHALVSYDSWMDNRSGIGTAIPIAILAYQLDAFPIFADSLEALDNVNLIDGYLEDVSSGGIDYRKFSTFVGASEVNRAFIDSGDGVEFIIPSNWIKTNLSLSGPYTVTVSNGLYSSAVNLNESFTIYPSETQDVIVEIQFNENGSPKKVRFEFSIVVNKTSNPAGLGGYSKVRDDIFYITSGQSQNLGANVEIEYACGHNSLSKPLIFVEGFNPDEFGGYRGGATYNSLYRDLYKATIVQYPGVVSLLNDLDNEGFDIVYVDFDQGAGDIKENAYVLEAVIKFVNEIKAQNGVVEPNIVMGESIGGIISRYALAHMEAQSEDHDVSYYISFDSPHLGANIPVAFQAMVEHLYYGGSSPFLIRNYIPELEDAYNVLHSPAAKQILRYTLHRATTNYGEDFMDDNWENVVFNGPWAESPEYNTFMDELSTMWPQNTIKNIGFANGNRESDNQGFGTLQRIFDAVCTASFSGCLTNVTGGIAVKYRFEVNSTPAYSTSAFKIYKGKMWHNILGIMPPIYLCHPKEIKMFGGRPLDSSPGGSYVLSDFGFDVSSIPLNIGTIIENFSFIPTVSALNIVSEKNNPYYGFTTSGLVAASKTSFDAVYVLDEAAYTSAYTAPKNEQHVLFTPSVQKMFDEQVFIGFNDIPGSDILDERFNFGEGSSTVTKDQLYGYYTVGSSGDFTGELCVNCSGEIGWNANSNENSISSHFTTFLGGGCGPLSTLNVENNGVVTVGHDANKTGSLVVLPYSLLHLKQDGKLKVNDNSSVVISKNGFLSINQGAVIELNGNNAVLHIRGKVILNNNAKLTFTGSGRIIMDQDMWVQSGSTWIQDFNSFWQIGDNVSIELSGSGNNDVVLELRSSLVPKQADGKTLNLFKILNGKVAMHSGKNMHAMGPVHFGNVRFTEATTNQLVKHQGLHLWGQQSIIVSNCIFSKGDYGIYAHNLGAGYSFTATNCTFQNNDYGARIEGKGVSFTGCNFIENSLGIFMDNVTHSSDVSGCDFIDNVNYGAYVTGQSGFSVAFEKNLFELNDIAIGMLEVESATLNCNQIQDNNFGIDAYDAVIFMGNEAYNSFIDNDSHISLSGSSESVNGIYMKDGYNKFIDGSSVLNGYIYVSSATALPLSDYTTSDELDFDNNEFPIVLVPNPSGTPPWTGQIPITLMGNYMNSNFTFPVAVDNVLNNITSSCGNGSVGPISGNIFEEYALEAMAFDGSVVEITGYNTNLRPILIDIADLISREGDRRSDIDALDLLVEILAMEDFWTIAGYEDLELMKIAYRLAKRAHIEAFKYGDISLNRGGMNSPDSYTQAIATFIEFRIGLIPSPVTTEEKFQVFRLNLDLAQLYRVGEYYDDAIEVLDNASSWTYSQLQSDRAGYWGCICAAEWDFVTSVTDGTEYLAEVATCKSLYPGATYKTLPINSQSESGVVMPIDESKLVKVVYPNPAKDKVTIELVRPLAPGEHLEIVNSLGQKVYDFSPKGLQSERVLTIDLNGLASGLYIIRIDGSQTENSKQYPFVVQ